jgi:uncharacterized lipoprotein YmbA
MRRTARIAFLCALAAAWAGCAAPRTAFYTLSPSADAAPPLPAADVAVSVGPVSVPEIVDRPAIVVRTGPNRVSIDEFNRWGSPLEDDIARVVASNLAALLGSPRVAAYPRAAAADGGYRVRIDVLAFESAPGETAVLDAAWTVRNVKDGTRRAGRSTISERTRGGEYSDLAAAHSRALGRMSADIAAAIRSMEGSASYPSIPSTRISRNR